MTDVDGVLTDGGMYYTKDGDIMKRFFVRDGMGVNLLKKQGIPTIIVTKEKNIVTKKWSDKMNIEKLYEGIIKKDDVVVGILTGRQKDAMIPVDYHKNTENTFAIPPKN